MSTLQIFLFGKFQGWYEEQPLTGLEVRKVQELFCYLLLYRNRPHPRETLADLLWYDTTTTQSKNYLRKALWQLQAAFDPLARSNGHNVLLVEPDWLQLNSEADLWLDVAVFEQAFNLLKGVPGKELNQPHAQILRNVVDLYRGDLLEGWYTEWCLYERERLQYIYLAMIDKLMDYCESHSEYESGITYGIQALRYDQACERTHQRLMLMQYLAGDRTAALRQYERCVTALDRELGVKPTERTINLYKQIQADHLNISSQVIVEVNQRAVAQFSELLDRFKRLQTVLTNIQGQVQQEIQEIELAVKIWH